MQSLQNSPCSLTQQMCNQDTLLLLLSSHFNSFPPHYHHSLRPSKFLALIGIHLSPFSQLCTLIQSNHSSMQTWLKADSLITELPGKPDYITPTLKISSGFPLSMKSKVLGMTFKVSNDLALAQSFWTYIFTHPLIHPITLATPKLLAILLKDHSFFSSVQFSHSVMSDSLWPHESQHARPPCPSPTPGVYSNSCPSSQWCHPAISSSVVPFSSCPQSLPASGYFPMSQLFAWGGQSIEVSASASVLPMNTQDWSLLRWTGWISLQSKGLRRVFSNITVQKHQFFCVQLSSQSNMTIHDHWKNHSLD